MIDNEDGILQILLREKIITISGLKTFQNKIDKYLENLQSSIDSYHEYIHIEFVDNKFISTSKNIVLSDIFIKFLNKDSNSQISFDEYDKLELTSQKLFFVLKNPFVLTDKEMCLNFLSRIKSLIENVRQSARFYLVICFTECETLSIEFQNSFYYNQKSKYLDQTFRVFVPLN
jgi:hypothetical protein